MLLGMKLVLYCNQEGPIGISVVLMEFAAVPPPVLLPPRMTMFPISPPVHSPLWRLEADVVYLAAEAASETAMIL
jgi:hypothetical protein